MSQPTLEIRISYLLNKNTASKILFAEKISIDTLFVNSPKTVHKFIQYQFRLVFKVEFLWSHTIK